MYTLKELEKIGPKLGVVSQSVKEVVTSLADDNLIETDKIGVSVYFWCFPAKERIKLEKECDDLKIRIEASKTELLSLENKLKELEKKCPETQERAELEQKYEAAKEEHIELENKIKVNSAYSFSAFKEMEEKIEKAKALANVYTDNIFECISMLKKKRPDLTETDIYNHFEIPAEIDNIS